MRRFFRLIFKLGLLAAIGVGVALAVKKLTAPPATPDDLEPWPPINPEPAITEPGTSVDDLTPGSTNGTSGSSEESSASSN
jgi:hypothetical protein